MGEIILGGRYVIENEIGTGGMAIVYKAHDKLLNRAVAVKVLRPEFKQDEDFIKRFDVEAKSAAGLSHPNIVSIYDVGIHEGFRYIVMEHIEGVTLKDYISEKGKLPWRTALKFASQICSALAHAHERKIIHRDIKPHNIMVGPDGKLKVMDFGIARATSAATMTIGAKVLGSAHYLSPEQARGGFTDERSDLYSLGVCLYEMITGKVPFDADTTVAVAMQHLQKDPQKPSELVENLPAAVEYIILKAMRKEQSQRYLDAQRMESDILRTLADPFVVLSDNDNEGFYSTKQIDIVDDSREKTITKKKKSILPAILGIAAAGIGIVAVISIVMVLFFGKKEAVEVPNLKGLTIELAEEKVKQLDDEIVIRIKDEEHSLKEEAGKIIRQEPEGGRPITGSKEIYVVIGLGEKGIEQETYIGEDVDDVQNRIESAGFVCRILEETDEEKNEEFDKDKVTRQEPMAGEVIQNGDVVTIYKSRGSKLLDVTGKSFEDAEKELKEAGYSLIRRVEEQSDKELGSVIKQSPEAGERVGKTEEIILTVAKKPVLTFTVPAGSSDVNVKIIRKDNGEPVYNRAHSPLDEISIEVKIKGTVTYEIYINDVFYTEKSVQG